MKNYKLTAEVSFRGVALQLQFDAEKGCLCAQAATGTLGVIDAMAIFSALDAGAGAVAEPAAPVTAPAAPTPSKKAKQLDIPGTAEEPAAPVAPAPAKSTNGKANKPVVEEAAADAGDDEDDEAPTPEGDFPEELTSATKLAAVVAYIVAQQGADKANIASVLTEVEALKARGLPVLQSISELERKTRVRLANIGIEA